jgi:spoIIIJ-associated protein
VDSTADETTGTAAPEGATTDVEAGAAPGAGSAAGADERAGGVEDDEAAEDGAAGRSRRAQLLDQEGDAAADYLEELLDIVDLDGDIDIDVENGRASVAVVAEGADLAGLQRLVGRDGEVLDALQELSRLAAQARTGERSRLLLDIAGWREQRRTTAARIAAEAVARARSTGESVELEPMPAYQRKAVHDAVADAGLRSESDGVEPNRFVVVHPS